MPSPLSMPRRETPYPFPNSLPPHLPSFSCSPVQILRHSPLLLRKVSPLPFFIGESCVTPAWEEAWLSREPEHHQQDKQGSDSLLCKTHGSQQPVLSLDDLEGSLLLFLFPFPKAKVLPEAAGRGRGQCRKGLHQARASPVLALEKSSRPRRASWPGSLTPDRNSYNPG